MIIGYKNLNYGGNDMDLTQYWELIKEKDMEIESLKKEIEILKQRATFDYTTGMKNKRECMEALNHEMKKVENSGSKFCVCFADIDGFKNINDTFGHCEGDYVLKKVSEIIKSNIRQSDELFRYGGDEFVIIFPEIDKREAEGIWSNITERINHCIQKSDLKYQVKLSAGFSEHSKENPRSLNSLELLHEADLKMYKNKR